MLKNLPMYTKRLLIDLINRIWHNSEFPSVREVETILPFAKPGKDSTIPANYHTIALTSCICKLMEKMVNGHLIWYLEHHKIYHYPSVDSDNCTQQQMFWHNWNPLFVKFFHLSSTKSLFSLTLRKLIILHGGMAF